METMTAGGLWSELQRRKIVQRALLYGIVAWVVIQAADIVIPALNIPEWGVSLVVVLLALGFPVAMILAWMFDRPSEVISGQRRPPQSARDRRGDEEDAGPRSIAVLPFVNMSDDKENEYFSDGMTEEILNALAKVPDLRVASRTSSFAFKGKVQDVLQIADELRVDTVVEGSVRKAQNRVRVTAQLINADDGYHLWSETYDRDLEDIFKVQDEIARSIVDALKLELVGEEKEHLVSPETEDVEAYTLYLKGRFFFNRYQETDLRRSLDHYAQALTHDPGYGRAYAGMADTWMQLADDWVAPETAYPEAKAAAEKAIELDDSLAEAHTARGKVLGWFEWDFDGAELALRRAVASNPRYADAHWGLASVLPSNGQMEAAIEEARTALSLDPLSGIFSYWLARFLYFARRYGEAREEATRAAELDPTSFRPHLVLGLCHLMEEPARRRARLLPSIPGRERRAVGQRLHRARPGRGGAGGRGQDATGRSGVGRRLRAPRVHGAGLRRAGRGGSGADRAGDRIRGALRGARLPARGPQLRRSAGRRSLPGAGAAHRSEVGLIAAPGAPQGRGGRMNRWVQRVSRRPTPCSVRAQFSMFALWPGLPSQPARTASAVGYP